MNDHDDEARSTVEFGPNGEAWAWEALMEPQIVERPSSEEIDTEIAILAFVNQIAAEEEVDRVKEAVEASVGAPRAQPYSQPRPLLHEALTARELYAAQSWGWVSEEMATLALEELPPQTRLGRLRRWFALKRCAWFGCKMVPEPPDNEHFGLVRVRCTRCRKVSVERRRHLRLVG